MLKKIKANNKGSMSYMEKLVMYMAVFFIGTFIIDIILLGMTIGVTKHQLSYVSNKLSFQGGFIGENKANSSHWTNKEIYEYLNAGMKKSGIDGSSHKWGLTYTEKLKTNSSSSSSTPVKVIDSFAGTNYTYQTSRRGLGNNLYEMSYIELYFQYSYRFSGKVFEMISGKPTFYIGTDFKNEYIN